MPRILRVAAIQVGRIDRGESRAVIFNRLEKLLEDAASKGVRLAVFPETTFCTQTTKRDLLNTDSYAGIATFFPRYYFEDLKDAELASYFEPEPETGITGVPALQAFFQRASSLNIDVAIGYGEQTPSGERYNTASYVCAKSKKAVGKYRKIHLPGTFEPFSKDPDVTNQLEKRYFLPGNLGFKAFRAPGLKAETEGAKSPIVGMLICNDRRWAEGWRVYGLQGVEIMCIGYNTTAWAPQLWGIDPETTTKEAAAEDAMFHHKLVCQAHAYTNSTFLITAARCGVDDGKHPLITGSMVVDPQGHIVAENKTEGDEVVWADIDLDACIAGKSKTFCFEKHRRIEHYLPITQQAGVVEPEDV